ncbi:DNA polymerase delta subunit 3 [Maniola jurtina]|uniref:DNA polymerase delta subunit 3 n=1 Tax=Maniola jurtina TaxID=191418 RepID=UPI001E689CF3|nr:DNA polymerase delta subunit 3 [Maniola jurtina]XP_045767171.1 DNA polymerase delta subunit 3 [Maniola jurtina]
MDAEDSYKTNLNTVTEMILDEEKLVTYITLSKDLCMHVNNSKQLLSRAVQKIREEQPNIQLNVSYIISGMSGSDAAIMTICTENDLDKLRKSLCVVFFYHVYSVCKGYSGVDNAAFLLFNKYEDYNLCPGLIRSKECIKRTSDEIGNLKTNSQEAIVLENKPLIVANKKLKQEPKHVSKSQVEETLAVKETEIISETKIKVEAVSPKKEFNNKQNVQKTNGLKTQKGIASFFNKSNSLQTGKVANSLQKNNGNNVSEYKKTSNGSTGSKVEDQKMDIDNGNNGIKMDIKKEVVDKKFKKESKSEEEKKDVQKEPVPSIKNKALNEIKKFSKVDKKRKRVLHVPDSESEEDNDPFVDNQEIKNVINNESEDEIPPTPSVRNSIKITSGIVNPKKRRKVVDKTYTDEDGYILTKKEEVYESCSENEDEVKVVKDIKTEKEVKKVESEVSPTKTKKSSPKKSKKKISPPQKGKQPTLNNFFKRK